MANALLEFYSGYRADAKGRTLDEIRAWDHVRLERDHEYIQWLFPLNRRSQFVEDAPVLKDVEILAFRSHEDLRNELLRSLDVMLAFYGFSRTGAEIATSPAWPERHGDWLVPGSHNFLRISRILASLSLLGLEKYALAFLNALKAVSNDPDAGAIDDVILKHWERSVKC